MKLASLKAGGRDGTLVVVSRDLSRCVAVPRIAKTLQAALDNWESCSEPLLATAAKLEAGRAKAARKFDPAKAHSPLPRAYHWVDGSAYVNHVELERKARGAEMPESFWHDPLVYQGGSDDFLGPRDDIDVASEDFGIDMEAETAVVTGNLGASLPVAGALAGGPVVGAAVLLFSQVFKEPLKGITRGYYRITGPWENPTVERVDAAAIKVSEQQATTTGK